MDSTALYFEDVDVGYEIGPVERVITDEQVNEFVRFWESAGPRNRFTDSEAAEDLDLPGPIVPGALNVAILSQLITGWSHTATLKKLDIVFRQIVRHNVPLMLKGVVTETRVVDGEPRLECDVLMEDEDGVSLVIGKATVALEARGN